MKGLRAEVRALSTLAAPAIVTQLSMMMLGVVDMILVGHVSVEALGAASLGRLWIFGTSLIGLGLLLGIDPLITQGHGARNARLLGLTLQRGLVLAAIVSVVMIVLWLFVGPMLRLFRQDPALVDLAENYVLVQTPSVLAMFGFAVLRQYLQGRAIMRPAMWIAVFAFAVNVFMSWTLIFGKFGAPALGLLGAGISTSLSRIFMFVALVVVVMKLKLHDGAWVPWSREAVSFSGMKQILRYGIPVGVQLGLELWMFQIATLLAGRLGSVALAAHTIALNLVSLAFMVPMGLTSGTVTRVGNLIGAGENRRAQSAAYVALGVCASCMAIAALLFAVLRHVLPRVYTTDAAVVSLAASILPIGAAFQVFDGTQAVGGGILRGMGRTRPAAVFNLIGYYVLAIPLAWWLAFDRGWGLSGVWWGLCLGIAVVSILLTIWIRFRGPAHVSAIAEAVHD